MRPSPGTSPPLQAYRVDDRTGAFLAQRHDLLIGGGWIAPREGGTLEVIDPGTACRIATERVTKERRAHPTTIEVQREVPRISNLYIPLLRTSSGDATRSSG